MRLLAIDPGAERWGWAILEVEDDRVRRLASGVWGIHRGKEGKKFTEPYQEYKLRLIEHVTTSTQAIIKSYAPDEAVYETLPVVNSGEWSGGAQRILGQVMVAASMAVCIMNGIQVAQCAVNTIKKNIGGSAKATKVKVRNGVISILPELADCKKQWTKIFEEPDAIATGLAHLGIKAVLE